MAVAGVNPVDRYVAVLRLGRVNDAFAALVDRPVAGKIVLDLTA